MENDHYLIFIFLQKAIWRIRKGYSEDKFSDVIEETKRFEG